MITVLPIIMVSVVVVAALRDIRTLQIPNYYPVIVLGLFVIFALFLPLAPLEIGAHALSMAIAFLIGLVLFILGLMGGGDVKLFSAIAIWVMPDNLLGLTFLVTISGLIISLVVFAWRVINPLAITGQKTITLAERTVLARTQKIPYGPAIAAGTCLFILPSLLKF